MHIKVSIIVPIYNVQNHIESCVRSLMEQSYENIEFIFIDDASPDRSADILEKVLSCYPEREVFCIKHQENRGLPSARNTGLQAANGDYIFHCDSDDWIDADMIERMVKVLKSDEVDIIYTDFYLSFHKNERYMKQPAFDSPNSCLKSMLSGSMKFNVWNKLVRRSLYTDHHISFPAGRSMGEDMTMIKLFCKAKSVKYLSGAFYHYMQTNPNAYTKRISDQQLDDIKFNTGDVIKYIDEAGFQNEFREEIQYFKLNIKLPFLISLDKKMYDLWRAWYPEANTYIGGNPSFSARIRFIQYAALKRNDWLVRAYNFLVIRFVYGVIYR